jgi:hypothetical protein
MPFHIYAFYAPGKGRGYMNPNLRVCAFFTMRRPGGREGEGDVVVGIAKSHDSTYIPGFSTDSEVLFLFID